MAVSFLTAPDAAATAAQLAAIEALPYLYKNELLAKLEAKGITLLECATAEDMLAAASAAEAANKRAFVSLAHADPALLAAAVAGHVPLVATLFASPGALLALRDSGAVLLLAESNQDLLDSVIRAYRMAEDHKILLPVVVGFDAPDGFAEPADVPSEHSIRKFLPALRMPHKLGVQPDGNPQRLVKAMENIPKVAAAIDAAWKKKFNRSWPAVELFHTADAEQVLVVSGYHSPTAKAAVLALREEGKKVGLARVRMLRPFPGGVVEQLAGKALGVLDTSFAPGSGGFLHNEVARFAKAASFIVPRYVSEKDVRTVFDQLAKGTKGTVWL